MATRRLQAEQDSGPGIAESLGARRLTFGSVARRTVLYVVLGAISVSVLFPVLWMFSASFRDNGSVLTSPFSFSGTWGIGNYLELFRSGDLFNWLGSSILVNISSVALIDALSVDRTYGFSAYDFPGKNVLFIILIVDLTFRSRRSSSGFPADVTVPSSGHLFQPVFTYDNLMIAPGVICTAAACEACAPGTHIDRTGRPRPIRHDSGSALYSGPIRSPSVSGTDVF